MSIAITTSTKKIKQALLEPTFYKVIQGGACFVGSTKILMADGSYKRIVDVHSGDKVLSRGEDGGIIETEVKRAWYAGDRKPLLKIKVNGRMIEATYDHKFYTSRGYKELYKIAWGKMEKSQRLQLQVLCKQYGQDFHLEEIWGETQPSDNETLCVYRQETRTAQRILQDAAGRKEYPGASGSSNNLVAKSRKQATSKSQKRHHYGQPSGEFRMGNQFGKSTPRLQDRSIATQNGGEEYKCFNDGRGSADDKNAMGHRSREIITQGICEEVWGIRGNDKGHFREQKLEAFAIDEIQVEEPQKVYSLEINHPTHNYFVSEANINVSNSASKTFSIMILLVGYAESYPNSLITVAGMTYNHLATGTMRDLKKILQETNRWDNERFNKTEKIYTLPNGSQIEFLSVDNMTSRGPRRDVLFVNEANGLNYETFDQLATRTRDFVILDYNPSSKFWAHEELVEGKQKDKTTFVTLTYLDNEALSKQERENIESRKPKEGEEPSNWWTVYGLGQIGSLEGNIYQGWEEATCREIRQVGKLVRYGLDFGFSNDETAMVAIYDLEDGKTGIEEVLYQKGILGSQYPEILMSHNIDPNVLIVADSARPEIIAEIKAKGYRIVGADKNPGSVKRGIDRVSQRQIAYCGSNLKREYLSYAWRKKRSGEILDEPQDGNDHCLPAETLVDTIWGQKRIVELVGKSGWLFSEEGKIRYFRNARQTGVEKILKITLADGTVFRCSEDHPVYTHRGIVPAKLLNTEDMIQWVYEKNNQSANNQRKKTSVQWHKLLERQKTRLLQKCTTQAPCFAQSCLGISSWGNTGGSCDRSYRPEQGQQSDRKFESGLSFGEQCKCIGRNYCQTEKSNGQNTRPHQAMACVRGREKMALGAWQACISEEKATRKRMCSVWEKILYNTILKKGTLLLRELSDEGHEAQAKRSTRGCDRYAIQKKLFNMWKRFFVHEKECNDMFAKMSKQKNGKIAKIEKDGKEPVYCLDVFDTSNFSIEGGVIVSNCMDATRYAIDDLSKKRIEF